MAYVTTILDRHNAAIDDASKVSFDNYVKADAISKDMDMVKSNIKMNQENLVTRSQRLAENVSNEFNDVRSDVDTMSRKVDDALTLVKGVRSGNDDLESRVRQLESHKHNDIDISSMESRVAARVASQVRSECKSDMSNMKAQHKSDIQRMLSDMRSEYKTALKSEVRSEVKLEVKSRVGSEVKSQLRPIKIELQEKDAVYSDNFTAIQNKFATTETTNQTHYNEWQMAQKNTDISIKSIQNDHKIMKDTVSKTAMLPPRPKASGR